MIKRIDELPAVLTSFAYRQEYFAEMEGMLATIREHHPDWPIVVGRGPISGFEMPTLEVESPSGKCYRSLPACLNIEGSPNDFFRITMIKGWWMSQVWRRFGNLVDGSSHRLVWSDADARFNGALDIELEPEAEVIAGLWYYDPETPDFDTINSGLLIFQGGQDGIVERIIDQWSMKCVGYMERWPPQTMPRPYGDQEVLNEVLQSHPDTNGDYVLLKLDLA